MRTQVGQLNVRVRKSLHRRVSEDKLSTNATKDIIVEVALDNWFSKFSPDQRRRFYGEHNRKPYAALKEH